MRASPEAETIFRCYGSAVVAESLGRGHRPLRPLPQSGLGRLARRRRGDRPAVRTDRCGARMDRRTTPEHRHQPVALGLAGVHLPLPLARAPGVPHLPHLHAGLRLLGREGPAGRAHSDSAARHSPKHSGAGLHAWADPGPGGALPAQQRGAGTGSGHHDLHRPGLEYDLQLLPLAALGALGHARSGHGVPLHLVAAPPMGRAPLRHYGAGMEQHDEHGRGLVFPHHQRSLSARHPGLPAAGAGVLHERRRRSGAGGCHGVRRARHDAHDRRSGPVALAAGRGLGAEVPGGGGRAAGGDVVLVPELAAPLPHPAPGRRDASAR